MSVQLKTHMNDRNAFFSMEQAFETRWSDCETHLENESSCSPSWRPHALVVSISQSVLRTLVRNRFGFPHFPQETSHQIKCFALTLIRSRMEYKYGVSVSVAASHELPGEWKVMRHLPKRRLASNDTGIRSGDENNLNAHCPSEFHSVWGDGQAESSLKL